VSGIALVLSGGGAKAAAHLGVYKALEHWELIPSRYVGTSMGAVVGACLAAGLGYEETLVRMAAIRRHDVAAISPGALLGYFSRSFLRGDRLRDTIAHLLPVRRFRELHYPLTVTAVDIQNGQLTLFGADGRDEVPLVDALYASCALPVYYPAARIGGRTYVDGGLRAVLPIDVAGSFDPDLIVAVNVGPSLHDETSGRAAALPPLVRHHGEVLRVMMAAQTELEIERWRGRSDVVLVQPVTEAEATFALESVGQYVGDGYRAAVRALVDHSRDR